MVLISAYLERDEAGWCNLFQRLYSLDVRRGETERRQLMNDIILCFGDGRFRDNLMYGRRSEYVEHVCGTRQVVHGDEDFPNKWHPLQLLRM